jgi:hypothetical protein
MSREAPLLSTLCDRLRGRYTLGVNDGAGPLNGSDTFTREFQTPPIQREAAEAIEALLAAQTKSMSDKDDEFTDRIDAAHPTCTNKHDDPECWARYSMALEMIGNRHGKYALVDLVNWLLKERDVRDKLLKEAAALFREYETHHRAKISEAGRPEKANRNALIAAKIEAVLK